MKIHRNRKADASYELNLAPFLDIIVSIIPMLLLSVVFTQIKMIETSIPQLVAQKIKEQQESKTPPVSISLKVEPQGFNFIVKSNGVTQESPILKKDGIFDYTSLTKTAASIKKQNLDIFSVDLLPDDKVSYDEIVQTMDAIRRIPASEGKFTITDSKTGQSSETDLMFPDVTFANVVE
jgi:biopolymer transport protein ExbD